MSQVWSESKVKTAFFLGLFFVLTQLLMTWPNFYEDGNYINYLASFLSDWDFNLINQKDYALNWVATNTGFDTSHHSPVQTPFLFLIYPLEFLTSLFTGPLGEMRFKLTSYMFAIMGTFLAFKFGEESLESLGFKLGDFEAGRYFLIFGSVYFYYGLLNYNTIEVFSFVVLSFCFREFVRLKNQEDLGDVYLLGLMIGIGLILKPAYKIFLIYFAILYFHALWKKNLYKRLVWYLAEIGVLLITLLLYRKMKFNILPNQFEQFSSIIDWSLSNMINKFLSLFSLKGLFLANPVLILVIPGFILFIKFLKKNSAFNNLDILILISWFLGSFFQPFLGAVPLYNDHLVGRLTLSGMPIFFISLYFFKTKLKNRKHFTLLASLAVFLSLFSTLYFISCDRLGHYYYAHNSGISLEYFQKGLAIYFEEIGQDLRFFWRRFGVGMFYMIFAYAFVMIWNRFKSESSKVKFVLSLLVLSVLFIPVFTSKENIRTMEKSGIYKEKAILGSGNSYPFSYLLDAHKYIVIATKAMGDEERKKKLSQKALDYVAQVRSDTIKSTSKMENYLMEYVLYFKSEL